ncbi:putative tRNA pseudouridine synthase B [uncultured archaeon]|nr:putative tRNA pseudouridine synthase B [uncultured archaeon]
MSSQQILVKQDSATDEKYGSSPEKRKIEDYVKNGLINLDKPKGPTSHEVAAWVRNIFSQFGVTKAGHSGTLDPNVTGVLPIALQNSVKIIPALIRAPKEYVAIMHLHKPVSEDIIRQTFRKFTGEIEQMPPKLSGVKKQLRKRNIYYLKILEIDGQDVLFRVGCEAGTYIRTLCVDFGKSLGIGAHMQELRRTKAGNFEESDSVNLQAVKDAVEFYLKNNDESELRRVVLPLEYGVRHLEKIFIKDNAVSAVSNGAPLHVGGISKLTDKIKPDEMIAIMSLKGELVAFGSAEMNSEQIMKSERGIAAKINRVVLQAGKYPRTW